VTAERAHGASSPQKAEEDDLQPLRLGGGRDSASPATRTRTPRLPREPPCGGHPPAGSEPLRRDEADPDRVQRSGSSCADTNRQPPARSSPRAAPAAASGSDRRPADRGRDRSARARIRVPRDAVPLRGCTAPGARRDPGSPPRLGTNPADPASDRGSGPRARGRRARRRSGAGDRHAATASVAEPHRATSHEAGRGGGPRTRVELGVVRKKLMSQGEYDGALEILNALYRSAGRATSRLRKLVAEAEAAFVEKAYGTTFRHKNPVPHLPPRASQTKPCRPSQFFLISRIDGSWDVKSINPDQPGARWSTPSASSSECASAASSRSRTPPRASTSAPRRT